jgi:hypothetical protein
MNEKEYRFTEIVTAISLLEVVATTFEDNDEITPEMLKIPAGTDGLDEPLFQALMTQAMHESDTWRMYLYNSLLNTAMSAVMERESILEQDLWAFTLAANVAWASQAGTSAMRALGLLSASAESAGLELPDYAFFPFKDPEGAQALASENPYQYLGGE